MGETVAKSRGLFEVTLTEVLFVLIVLLMLPKKVICKLLQTVVAGNGSMVSKLSFVEIIG